MKKFTTTSTVIEGEFETKTSYLSWEFEGQEGWAQGEFQISLYNGAESVIHEVTDENNDTLYVVIASIK